MKVRVNRELCEANAICVRHCAEMFRVEDDDTLSVLMEEVPEALRAGVKDAVECCPRQALSLET